jgi:hypothetical protein
LEQGPLLSVADTIDEPGTGCILLQGIMHAMPDRQPNGGLYQCETMVFGINSRFASVDRSD